MSDIKIYDTNDNNNLAYEGPAWGATDALVNLLCDNHTPQDVYDACCELGDAIANNDPTDALEAFLGVTVE